MLNGADPKYFARKLTFESLYNKNGFFFLRITFAQKISHMKFTEIEKSHYIVPVRHVFMVKLNLV